MKPVAARLRRQPMHTKAKEQGYRPSLFRHADHGTFSEDVLLAKRYGNEPTMSLEFDLEDEGDSCKNEEFGNVSERQSFRWRISKLITS